MGATFGRIKNWIAEVLSYADLNAEIDNILTNFTPSGVDDYSTNLAQMQVQTAPAPGGVPSLATSLAAEIARLRYQISAIMGSDVDYWYEAPPIDLSTVTNIAYGEGLPNSRLETTAGFTSIDPNGVTNAAVISASLKYWVEGVSYVPSGTIALTGLASAPTSNQTALVNDSTYVGQASTAYATEYNTVIKVDTVGSEITSVINKLSAFKVVHSGTTEYFIAEYINDAVIGTCLQKGRRGMFFDSNGAPVARVALSDNDVITLCKLAWVFVTTSSTVTVTYNTPIYSTDAPTSPSTGDFWFDQTTTNWKVRTPGGWTLSSATLLGMVVMDGAACVASRTADPFTFYDPTNEIDLEVTNGSTTEIRQKGYGGKLSVYAQIFNSGFKNKTWDTALDLVTGSVANSTTYYVYVKEDGDCVLSIVAPHDRRSDLRGYYYPTEKWRCLGYATTNGSAALLPQSVVSFSRTKELNFLTNALPYQRPENVRTVTTTYTTTNEDDVLLCSSAGGAYSITLNPAGLNTGKKLRFVKTDTNAGLITIDGNSTETIGSMLTIKMATLNDFLEIVSDGTNWQILSNGIAVSLNAFSKTPTGTLNGSDNLVTFGSVSSDPHGLYNVSTGDLTVVVPGWYSIKSWLNISWASGAVTTYIGTLIRVNGASVQPNYQIVQSASVLNLTVSATVDAYLSAGQVIQFRSQTTVTTPVFSNALSGSGFSVSRIR